ncbi:hypothetical protein F3087_41600 [Nocardia colli]|uniref:Uncharacterized protein n=1 Tax=Nocardia colli TaxID=2545717 RepID=A0A5N0DWD4_9NOCA|nr:hypothetical protein [Nocardia colli]KAA8880369.1 hypothetical protein F3087_41600 [Nocardia colli]
MSTQETVSFPLPRERDGFHDLVPPAPLDESPTYISPVGEPATATIAQFTLIGILESRIRTLTCELRLLRDHVHKLTVALDDSLDRESAHALCSQHERLGPPLSSTHRPGTVGQSHCSRNS